MSGNEQTITGFQDEFKVGDLVYIKDISQPLGTQSGNSDFKALNFQCLKMPYWRVFQLENPRMSI